MVVFRLDDLISDVLTERGSLQHLRFLICMLRHFFTLSQKSLFIALAPGDFNRKRKAQILIQTMHGQHIEGEGTSLHAFVHCLAFRYSRPYLVCSSKYWGRIRLILRCAKPPLELSSCGLCAVSRKLVLKRMINKSREKMPDSTEGTDRFFEVEGSDKNWSIIYE